MFFITLSLLENMALQGGIWSIVVWLWTIDVVKFKNCSAENLFKMKIPVDCIAVKFQVDSDYYNIAYPGPGVKCQHQLYST